MNKKRLTLIPQLLKPKRKLTLSREIKDISN